MFEPRICTVAGAARWPYPSANVAGVVAWVGLRLSSQCHATIPIVGREHECHNCYLVERSIAAHPTDGETAPITLTYERAVPSVRKYTPVSSRVFRSRGSRTTFAPTKRLLGSSRERGRAILMLGPGADLAVLSQAISAWRLKIISDMRSACLCGREA